jgi:hypothetical protein
MKVQLSEGSVPQRRLYTDEVSWGFGNTKSAKPTQKAQRKSSVGLRFLCFFLCAFCVPAAPIFLT